MNEREDNDKYEEEGEYHFTEDQVNYEPEEEAKEKPAATDWRNTLTTKASQNRRFIVGGLVFIVLLFVVYKVLMPASNNPSTQFTQTTAPTTHKNIASAPPAPTPTTTPPTVTQNTSQPGVNQVPNQPATQTPQVAGTTIPVNQPNPLAAPSPQEQVAAITATQQPYGSPLPNAQGGAITTISTSTTTTATPDKVTMLEQENARLMNMLQSDNAQKIAEQQTQNSALQSKIQDLNNRIAMLESNLVKMTQMLQTASRPSPLPAPPCMAPCAVPKALGPRIAYTVQAIIPGRAWLKSDVGDTITVAEGDVLRCVGRITKIDPYDGVVQIDTGNRILTLSYGVNAD